MTGHSTRHTGSHRAPRGVRVIAVAAFGATAVLAVTVGAVHLLGRGQGTTEGTSSADSSQVSDLSGGSTSGTTTTSTDGTSSGTTSTTTATTATTGTTTTTKKKTTKTTTSTSSSSTTTATKKKTTTTTTTKKKTTTTTSSGGSGGSVHNAAERKVLALVNEERAAAGCDPVTADATLAQVAAAHSKDMAVNDYFDHNSQDGTTPFQRITAAGYDYSTAAENIAAGQQTAADVMESWMNSEGHRENILNCDLTELGVGVYEKSGSTYGIYWTQDFGTPQ